MTNKKIPCIIKHDDMTVELRFMHEEIPHGISVTINGNRALIMGVIYYYKMDTNTENVENVTPILDGIVICNWHLNFENIDADKIGSHICSKITDIFVVIGKNGYNYSLNRIADKFINTCIEIINKK